MHDFKPIQDIQKQIRTEQNRTCYGFEVDKKFYKLAKEKMLVLPKQEQQSLFV